MATMFDFSTWSESTKAKVLALAGARCYVVVKPGFIKHRRADLLPHQDKDSYASPVSRPADVTYIPAGTVVYIPKHAVDFVDHPSALLARSVSILTPVRMSILEYDTPFFVLSDRVGAEIERGETKENDLLKLLGR